MRIDRLLAEATVCVEEGFKQHPGSIATARLDVELLLAHVLEKPTSYFYTWPEKELGADKVTLFKTLVQRRTQGEPVAYLTGKRSFWSLDLTVTKDVLIPRPETEHLVEAALSLTLPPKAQVADLGTGSGAIALALASERPDWRVTAIDRSEQAIAVAQNNALDHNLHNITFRLGEWCKALSVGMDLIVSNPPYIRSDDPHINSGDVRFEPRLALVSGSDGLKDIRLIAAQSRAKLLPRGWLILEHGYDQKKEVHHILENVGYQRISTGQDLSGQDRVTQAQRPN